MFLTGEGSLRISPAYILQSKSWKHFGCPVFQSDSCLVYWTNAPVFKMFTLVITWYKSEENVLLNAQRQPKTPDL